MSTIYKNIKNIIVVKFIICIYKLNNLFYIYIRIFSIFVKIIYQYLVFYNYGYLIIIPNYDIEYIFNIIYNNFTWILLYFDYQFILCIKIIAF